MNNKPIPSFSKQFKSEHKSARPNKNIKPKKPNARENQVAHRTVNKATTIVPLKMSAIEKMLEDVHKVLPATPAANSKEVVVEEVVQSPKRGHQIMKSVFQESNEECDEVAKKRSQQLMYRQLLQEQIMEKKKVEENKRKEKWNIEQIEEGKIKEDNGFKNSEMKRDFITGSRRAGVPNRTDVIYIITLRYILKERVLFSLEMKNSY